MWNALARSTFNLYRIYSFKVRFLALIEISALEKLRKQMTEMKIDLLTFF